MGLNIRENSNMTMDELGGLLGVTKTTISKWESGVRSIPDKQLTILEGILDIPKCSYKKSNLSSRNDNYKEIFN